MKKYSSLFSKNSRAPGASFNHVTTSLRKKKSPIDTGSPYLLTDFFQSGNFSAKIFQSKTTHPDFKGKFNTEKNMGKRALETAPLSLFPNRSFYCLKNSELPFHQLINGLSRVIWSRDRRVCEIVFNDGKLDRFKDNIVYR